MAGEIVHKFANQLHYQSDIKCEQTMQQQVIHSLFNILSDVAIGLNVDDIVERS